MSAIFRLSLLVAAWAVCAAQAAAAPKVVVSIPPLHSLVAGVMEGVATPELLVRGSASIHTYTLRPSQLRVLGRAQVIFRVGPELESFLDKPLATLGDRVRVVDLIHWPGMVLLPSRRGGVWQQDPHRHGTREHTDNHIWLDPRNAGVIVGAVAATLSRIDPEHAGIYGANGKALSQRLEQLDRHLTASLLPVGRKPYLVFHDAYRYLEARYGLNAIGAVVATPERAPGALRIRNIRKQIRQNGIRCLFREPQFHPSWINLLTEESAIRVADLDPLGADLQPGPGLYFSLMQNLASALTACLNRP
ncbi:MAG TPA: zinc ABC transporter substrate-binding protein [Gammaproteobacteria bacterium]|nr:zinc ABC transporter substrate-binding protein [Gammaproteobacteria bacterium]